MRLLHFSDNHGSFPDFWKSIDSNSIDAIVCSGDFFPNWSFGFRDIEIPRQESWLKSKMQTIAEWLRDKPFLFCGGNHDFITPCGLMKQAGLDVRDLNFRAIIGDQNRLQGVDFGGLRFYGSQWVPHWTGTWNYELSDLQMQLAIQEIMDNKPDVVVSHSPVYGLADKNYKGEYCGSRRWREWFNENDSKEMYPKAYLCGHIHESSRLPFLWRHNMIYSNAATIYNIIDLK